MTNKDITSKVGSMFQKEGMALLSNINVLRERAVRVSREVTLFHNKYTNKSFDGLDWEKKEWVLSMHTELGNKLRDNADSLLILEGRYEEFRNRVNKHYGKEVIIKYESTSNIMGEEEDDSGDWWKKA